MRIHKEGYIVIMLIMAVVLTILWIVNLLFPQQGIVHYILYVTGAVFVFLVIRFFRNPTRTGEEDDTAILSAADGTIVEIEETLESEYFNDRRIKISVFMSVMNVHVNRVPFSGKVCYVKYHPGKFLFALKPKSSLDNERNSIVIKHQNGKEVLVRQIAGGLARRIVCYLKKEDRVKARQEIGMIKFGSRVDFFLPLSATVDVKIGQKVRSAQTVIARFT